MLRNHKNNNKLHPGRTQQQQQQPNELAWSLTMQFGFGKDHYRHTRTEDGGGGGSGANVLVRWLRGVIWVKLCKCNKLWKQKRFVTQKLLHCRFNKRKKNTTKHISLPWWFVVPSFAATTPSRVQETLVALCWWYGVWVFDALLLLIPFVWRFKIAVVDIIDDMLSHDRAKTI